jgi:hypothetical protein
MRWINQLMLAIGAVLCLVLGFGMVHGLSQPHPPAILPSHLRTHYLLDHEYQVDSPNLFATMGHLLVFNPSDRPVKLRLTLYSEAEAPQTFDWQAPAKTSSESNYESWPVQPKPNHPFALKVESSAPVVCQSTIGWTNTNNDYASTAKTKSPKGIRETAKSYIALNQLDQDWYVPDGIVINKPDQLWLKESEWALLLNPGHASAEVTLVLYYGKEIVRHQVTVPAQRLKRVFMDDLVQPNQHYGTRIISTRPIAAQWLRQVNWYDSPELMANWAISAVPSH